jgi:putative transposase
VDKIEGGGREGRERVRSRLEVVQEILSAPDRRSYREREVEGAKRLELSLSSIQRLVREWKKHGVEGLSWRERSDRGGYRISGEWREFIERTYREGNEGSRQMTPAQVYVRVKVEAEERGGVEYPSHMSVYRVLNRIIERGEQPKRSIGWKGRGLTIKTREGIEIGIERSNQVWQCDHTLVDVLVVGQGGEILGRPWLTIVVDTYSRCVMGIHLGFDAPSASVVCLALRHAILPKQYSGAYELKQSWGTYGLPQYLYTDGGKDFRSQHIEQVATELGIVVCLRRKPSDGGIVERPFGTFNSQLFSSLPGYTNSNVSKRSSKAESEASLSLMQLEQLLVRYLVDNYNQMIDARMGDQSRIGRWEAGRIAQLALMGERELDNCLMRRERRRVYRSGYIQFANLTYQGEHLGAYAGESIIIRYNPRDITTIYIYWMESGKEVFLTRAHAQGWETETLSYKEAQVLSQRRREAGKAIDNRSMLAEVRDRDNLIKKMQRKKTSKKNDSLTIELNQNDKVKVSQETESIRSKVQPMSAPIVAPSKVEDEVIKPKKVVPHTVVHDYEQLKRKAGLL